MLYNRCTGIYKFGNNTYPRRIRCKSNLGHIFWQKKSASYGLGNMLVAFFAIIHVMVKNLICVFIVPPYDFLPAHLSPFLCFLKPDLTILF